MTHSLQDGGARFPAHRRKANRCAVGKQSSELRNSAKKIPYMRERKTSIQAQWRTLVSRRAAQAQRGDRVGGGEDYCSKVKTAGFGSLIENTTNFDGET